MSDDKKDFGFADVSAEHRTFPQTTDYQTHLSLTQNEVGFLTGSLCYLQHCKGLPILAGVLPSFIPDSTNCHTLMSEGCMLQTTIDHGCMFQDLLN